MASVNPFLFRLFREESGSFAIVGAISEVAEPTGRSRGQQKISQTSKFTVLLHEKIVILLTYIVIMPRQVVISENFPVISIVIDLSECTCWNTWD